MRHLSFLFLLSVTAFWLTSCDPKEDPPKPEFKATVNGLPFVSNNFTASRINGRVEIEAVGADTSTLLIILPSDTARVYNLNDSKIVLAYKPYNGDWHTSQFEPGNPGNVTIIQKDTTKMEIRGTFFGNVSAAVAAISPVAITNGSFQVLEVITLPAPSISNRFSYVVGSDSIASANVSTTAPNLDDILTVLGNLGNKSLSFNIRKDALGRYNLPDGNQDITMLYGDVPSVYGATAGRFVIMRNDQIARRLTALFQISIDNLSTSETKEIRHGYFDVKY
jgi:hypothetical protein